MKASQVIGYSLRVLKDGQPLFLGLPMPGKEPVKVYQSGSITPQIDSYYEDPTNKKVYWTFQNPGGISYYIEHKSGGTFELVKLPTTDIIQGQPPATDSDIILPDFGNIITESSKYLFFGGLIILAILIAKK